MSKIRKRSKVWDQFYLDGNKATCKLCKTTVCHSGSTSNLINHLRVHKEIGEMETSENIVEPSVIIEEPTENIEEFVEEVYETEQTNVKFEAVFDDNPPPELPVETVNVETACRICLCDVKSTLHFGVDEVPRDCNNVTYHEIFSEFSGFDIISQEPQYFCLKCSNKLVSIYELKQKCNETQVVLDEWVKNEQELLQEEETLAATEEKIEENPMDYIIEEVEDEEQLYSDSQTGNVEYEQVESLEEVQKKSIFHVPVNVEVLEESHDCEICNVSYHSRRTLRAHYVQLHPELKNMDCPHCQNKQFALFINDHVRSCRKLNVPSPCEICGVVILARSMARHLKSCRLSGIDPSEKPFQCDICGVRTVAKYGMVKHMQIQHMNRRIHCEYCLTEFKTPSVLGAHIRKYHPDKKPPLKCKICDFQTSDASVLRRHHLYHTGEKRHKCETCGREFRAKDVLRDHMTTHSDERPFPCETCQSRFKTRKALGVHMKTHRAHEYECPKCKRTYLTNQQMRIHVKRVHPEYELPPKGTIFNKNWRIKKAREEIKEMALKEGFDVSVLDSMMIEEPPSIDQKIYIRTNYTNVGLIEEV